MRKDRSDNHQAVVIFHTCIHLHRNFERQHAIRNFSGLLFRQCAELPQGIRIVPFMIEQSHIGIPSVSFLERNTDQLTDRLFAHGRMSPQSHNQIETCHVTCQMFVQRTK